MYVAAKGGGDGGCSGCGGGGCGGGGCAVTYGSGGGIGSSGVLDEVIFLCFGLIDGRQDDHSCSVQLRDGLCKKWMSAGLGSMEFPLQFWGCSGVFRKTWQTCHHVTLVFHSRRASPAFTGSLQVKEAMSIGVLEAGGRSIRPSMCCALLSDM